MSDSVAVAKPRHSWRVVDIVVAAVLGVAVGVVFWGWSALYPVIGVATAAFPPIAGLYAGGWLIAGVLGGLIIRKPGAALFCELIAAAVEGVLGTHFGMTVLISGFVQGVGAELGFALFRYRKFNLLVAVVAGLVTGLFLGVSENILYNNQWAFVWQLSYVVAAMVSGVVIAGLLSWFAARALAKTGALSAFASGRSAKEI
ncbi:ECF transporter S component [Saxibacter everestensis]|uniref:ECF transporter S component n=1 Tax=Saxibacter everestensis TaxID=2909229 RepID=A0ABY8QSV2_9MICO|nr:ECF transporter S component [Brevibacteriaceae bacterium ZFBP1038]